VGAKWLGQKAHPHRRRFTKPNTRDKRSLRLSSIKALKKEVDAHDDDEAVALTKAECVSLLEDISHLSDSLNKLQLKVEKTGK